VKRKRRKPQIDPFAVRLPHFDEKIIAAGIGFVVLSRALNVNRQGASVKNPFSSKEARP
jgi:hypothetical protein